MPSHFFEHKGSSYELRFTHPEPSEWRVSVFHNGQDTGLESIVPIELTDEQVSGDPPDQIRRYLIMVGETIVGIVPGFGNSTD